MIVTLAQDIAEEEVSLLSSLAERISFAFAVGFFAQFAVALYSYNLTCVYWQNRAWSVLLLELLRLIFGEETPESVVDAMFAAHVRDSKSTLCSSVLTRCAFGSQ